MVPSKPASRFGIGPDRAMVLARLLHVLAEGERIAAETARAQSKLLMRKEPRIAAFLTKQSYQERFHYRCFKAATLWLTPRYKHTQINDSMSPLAIQLQRDTSQNDITASIIGLQVGLEALGDAFLNTIAGHMQKRGMGLARLQHIISMQEQAHHAFGIRYIDRTVAEGRHCTAQASIAAESYQWTLQQLVESIAPLLISADLDPKPYQQAVQDAMSNVTSAVCVSDKQQV